MQAELVAASLDGADNPSSHSVTQLERTADGHDELTRAQLAGFPKLKRRQFALSTHKHNG